MLRKKIRVQESGFRIHGPGLLLIGLVILWMSVVGTGQANSQDIRGTIVAEPNGIGGFLLTVKITEPRGVTIDADELRILPELWTNDKGRTAYFTYGADPNRYLVADANGIPTIVLGADNPADSNGIEPNDTNTALFTGNGTQAGRIVLLLQVKDTKLHDRWLALDSCVVQYLPLVGGGDSPWYVDKDHEWPYQNGSEKAPFVRIHDAVMAAEPNDIIVIAEGIYQEPLVIDKPGLKFHTRNGRRVTLSGGDLLRVVTIDANDGSPVHFNGFIIEDGDSPDNGGGVYCKTGSVDFVDCIIRNHKAANGGGMAIEPGCEVTLTECHIGNNEAAGNGGGIYASGQNTLTIQSCEVFNNTAQADGGGLYGHATIKGTPHYTGDSVCSQFRANTAHQAGGAVYAAEEESSITNCIFSGNRGNTGGAAVLVADSASVSIYQCTFIGNLIVNQGDFGVAIHSQADASVILRNSILWDRDGLELYPMSMISEDPDKPVQYCNIKGASSLLGSTSGLHIIDEDPQFWVSGYWTGDNRWIDGNYRLKNNSPSINAGDPNPDPNNPIDAALDRGGLDHGAYAGTREAGA